MPKYIHDGGSSIFTLLSKKLVRPFGFKKIRTSTGSFQTISASSRGKGFKFFGPFRTKSTGNLTKRMNYMNKRISGKTQKVEGYAFKLKEAQMASKSRFNNYKNQINTHTEKITQLKALKSAGTINPKQLKELKNAEASVRSLQKTQKSIIKSYVKKSAKIKRKMSKAQTRLNYKVTKYAAKQKKYKGLMERKLYKSQKRLDKGFTKTCKNLKKTPGKSPMACLEAFEKCKAKGNSLNLEAMTGCVNAESLAQGLPTGLKQGDITTTMTKLANKHFLRRFKRGRHLREISRITSGKGAKLQTSMNETAKTLQYGKVLGDAKTVSKVGILSKARTRQLTGQNIVPGSGIKDFSSPQSTRLFNIAEKSQLRNSARAIQASQKPITDEIAHLQSISAPASQINAHRFAMSSHQADFEKYASSGIKEETGKVARHAMYAEQMKKIAAIKAAAPPRKPTFSRNGPTALFKSKNKGLQFNKSASGVVNPAYATGKAPIAPVYAKSQVDLPTYGLVGPT